MKLPLASAHDVLPKIDVGWGVVGLMATLAVWPFLTRPGLPTLTDAELHAYRTYEIISAWQAGLPYLRWAPDLFFGFGYPLFNYYAPLTYYLGAAYGVFGGGAVAGVKFVFVLSAYLGTLGIYQLARDQWGSLAGVVSAVVYAFSPYIVYMDPHARGALPETFALALTPWVWWALKRLSRRPTGDSIATAAIIVAALFLSHNLMPWLGVAVGLAWVVWEDVIWPRWTGDLQARVLPELKSLLKIGGALLLGIGLTSFMWLPAMLERDAVQYQNAFQAKDSGFTFVSAEELFSPVSPTDMDSPDLHFWKFRLGLPQWLLGLVGVMSLGWAKASRSTTLFFTSVALAGLFFILPISGPVWAAVGPLRYLQFPWRLLGLVALALSLLAGAATHWAKTWPWLESRWVFSLTAVTACLWGAAPLLNPLPWSNVGPLTLQRMFALERSGIWGIGTTHDGEFLPIGVQAKPIPQASVFESYDAGHVDKIDHARLPPTTQVTLLDHSPNRDEFLIEGQTDFTLRVFTFYFPGWIAYLDEVKTPIAPADPEGWITVAVPTGTHTLRLRFEDTWPRRWGWWLSGWSGLIGLGVVAWEMGHPLAKLSRRPVETLSWRWGLSFMVVLTMGFALRLWDDHADAGRWRGESELAATLEADYPLQARLEDNLVLVGFDLPQTQAQPGAQVPLTLYWQAQAPIPADLSVFVHFLGPDGQLWGQSDKINAVTFFPTSRWPFNRVMVDAHSATLRPEAPPGEYQVVAGMWDRVTGVRRHLLDADGAPTALDGVVLTTTFRVQP